jgi:hypothetical protein
MQLSIAPRPYFSEIESKIIEEIQHAKSSILIAMAWFTSREIQDALLSHKLRYPQINIEIVVDNNEYNMRYFYSIATKYRQSGIVIHPQPDKMLHHKFMVIDNTKTMMGSYNYSKNARTNLESICVYEDMTFSGIYTKIFRTISNKLHIDENINLLIKFPDFARKLLSMYYPFTPSQFQKYTPLLIAGDCFTYDNGYRDSIDYSPGYFYNSAVTPAINSHPAFPKPYSKKNILRWKHNEGELAIIDSFREYPEQWHMINDQLHEHEEWFKSYYKRLIESTHTTDVLETLIQDSVDIVMEDRLWEDNFAPFIKEDHLNAIFESISNYQITALADE